MGVLLSIFGRIFAEPPSLLVDRPRYSVAHVAEESNEATIQKLAGRIKYALRIAFGRAAAEQPIAQHLRFFVSETNWICMSFCLTFL